MQRRRVYVSRNGYEWCDRLLSRLALLKTSVGLLSGVRLAWSRFGNCSQRVKADSSISLYQRERERRDGTSGAVDTFNFVRLIGRNGVGRSFARLIGTANCPRRWRRSSTLPSPPFLTCRRPTPHSDADDDNNNCNRNPWSSPEIFEIVTQWCMEKGWILMKELWMMFL